MFDLNEWLANHAELETELKSKHPNISFITFDGIEQVFGIIPSSRDQLYNFMTASMQPNLRNAAVRRLVLACTPYPALQNLRTLLDQHVGLANLLSNEIASDSGSDAELEELDIPQETEDLKTQFANSAGVFVCYVEAIKCSVAIQKPSKPAYDRFCADVEARPGQALDNLTVDCLLFPSLSAYKELAAKKPGISIILGKKALELAGLNREVRRKK